jgi:hypothetical protein
MRPPASREDVSGFRAIGLPCALARRALEVGHLQANGDFRTAGFSCRSRPTRPFYPPYKTFLARYPGYEIACARRRSGWGAFRFRWTGLRHCPGPVSDPSSPLFDDTGGLTRYMSCAIVRRAQLAGSYKPNDFATVGFACQTWALPPGLGYESACVALGAKRHPPPRAFSFGWGSSY